MISVSAVIRSMVRQLSSTANLSKKWTAASQLPQQRSRKHMPKEKSAQDSAGVEQEPWSVGKPKVEPKMRSRIGEFKELPPSMRSKFKLFEDESEEVLDSAQLQWIEVQAPATEQNYDEFEGLSLERGKTGVFDIHELVEVFRMENAENIFVTTIPPELLYADYLILVSGKSSRHLTSMAQFVAKYYKAKKHEKDPFLTNSVSTWNSEWISLDFGNIVVHFMDKKLRELYDIEALWALGPEHDGHCQKPKDKTLEFVEKASRIVEGLEAPRKRTT